MDAKHSNASRQLQPSLLIAASARIVGGALRLVKSMVREGISTQELDEAVEEYIRSQGAKPSFKGYRGFPASACISINDVVVHGIPSARELCDGDIVSVDVGAFKGGYHGDGAWTFAIGEASPQAKRLMELAQQDVTTRWRMIEQLAAMSYGDGGEQE